MGFKIYRFEFEKRFKDEYKTATIARDLGFKTPNSLYAAMNPNSKYTLGKEKVRLMKEKYNIPETVEMFYEITH